MTKKNWIARAQGWTAAKGVVAILAVSAVGSPALAHHSAAMFDATKTVTIEGSVKKLDWTNPHAWLHVVVPGPAGAPSAEWSIEFGSPNSLYRQGLRPSSLKPGDKISVTMAPLKDGSNGGQFRSMVMPDGKTFGKRGADV